MILYHGTNKAFDTIDLTKSKPNKDFGQGFYLSREHSQALRTRSLIWRRSREICIEWKVSHSSISSVPNAPSNY